MGSLTKEIHNIQNPALSAYLLSRFVVGYFVEEQKMVPLPLLFIVLPVIYKKDIYNNIISTQKKSGLRYFSNKFTDAKNCNNDLIIQIHGLTSRYKIQTWEAFRIGIIGKLFAIQEGAFVLPLENNVKTFVPRSKEVEKMGKAAEKFGSWCAKLSLSEVSQILKVRF